MADGLPQVPTIASAPIQTAADGVASSGDIMSLVSGIANQANMKLPDQYTTTRVPTGVDANGNPTNLPKVVHKDPLNADNRPIANTVADLKHARRKNAVADLAKTVNG